MANVRYANPIVRVSGKIAGNVFTRDKSGNKVRCMARRVKQQTSAQLIRRAAFRACVVYVKQYADQSFYDIWQNYADRFPAKNKLGENIKLNWWHWFLHFNLARLVNGVSILHYPPEL